MSRVGEDLPNPPIVMLVQALVLHPGVQAIVLVSGRDESARAATLAWLSRMNVPFDSLNMRAVGDGRPDSIVKREILEECIVRDYSVLGVIDDRASVVEMWRSSGLTCLQVAPGDF